MSEIQAVGTVTKVMVDAYRRATRDTNKFHEAYALGFQLEFILERTVRSRLNPFQCDYRPCRIATQFNEPVPVDSEITTVITTNETDDSTFGARLLARDSTVATHTFDYSPHAVSHFRGRDNLCTQLSRIATSIKQAHASREEKPFAYELTQSDAVRSAEGIGHFGEDYVSLAVGLSSSALLERKARMEVVANIANKELPRYDSHDIILLPGAYDLHAGDKIDLYVDMQPVFEECPANGKNAGEMRENIAKRNTLVYAERSDGTPLYSVESRIRLMREAAIVKILQKLAKTMNP